MANCANHRLITHPNKSDVVEWSARRKSTPKSRKRQLWTLSILACVTPAPSVTFPSPAPISMPVRVNSRAPTRARPKTMADQELAHPSSKISIRSWQAHQVIKENLIHSRIKVAINRTRFNNLTELPMPPLNSVAINSTSRSASKKMAKS